MPHHRGTGCVGGVLGQRNTHTHKLGDFVPDIKNTELYRIWFWRCCTVSPSLGASALLCAVMCTPGSSGAARCHAGSCAFQAGPRRSIGSLLNLQPELLLQIRLDAVPDVVDRHQPVFGHGNKPNDRLLTRPFDDLLDLLLVSLLHVTRERWPDRGGRGVGEFDGRRSSRWSFPGSGSSDQSQRRGVRRPSNRTAPGIRPGKPACRPERWSGLKDQDLAPEIHDRVAEQLRRVGVFEKFPIEFDELCTGGIGVAKLDRGRAESDSGKPGRIPQGRSCNSRFRNSTVANAAFRWVPFRFAIARIHTTGFLQCGSTETPTLRPPGSRACSEAPSHREGHLRKGGRIRFPLAAEPAPANRWRTFPEKGEPRRSLDAEEGVVHRVARLVLTVKSTWRSPPCLNGATAGTGGPAVRLRD